MLADFRRARGMNLSNSIAGRTGRAPPSMTMSTNRKTTSDNRIQREDRSRIMGLVEEYPLASKILHERGVWSVTDSGLVTGVIILSPS